jgi:heme oxygenase
MTVRARLRAVTEDIHQALHGAAPFARIAAGDMDTAGYGALLQFLHGYHAGMMAACSTGAAALGAQELGAAQAARVTALAQDLAHFGLPPPRLISEPVPDADFAIGCLYTVQGSTLGGKVICHQLDALLPDGRGRSFFAGTPQDGAHWRILCEKLEQQGGSARLEAGALHAFHRFAALLESDGRQRVA